MGIYDVRTVSKLGGTDDKPLFLYKEKYGGWCKHSFRGW